VAGDSWIVIRAGPLGAGDDELCFNCFDLKFQI